MKRRCEIRNNPGMSSYFGGGYRAYGLYQWNIKFYGFQAEWEIEIAQQWVFGDYIYSKGHFEYLNEVVGRPVKASIQGRSGGWLVIDEELTDEERAKVDAHVAASMKALPEFLKEERAYHSSLTTEEENDNE